METFGWLEQHVTGFQDLPVGDRHVILCLGKKWGQEGKKWGQDLTI